MSVKKNVQGIQLYPTNEILLFVLYNKTGQMYRTHFPLNDGSHFGAALNCKFSFDIQRYIPVRDTEMNHCKKKKKAPFFGGAWKWHKITYT